MQLWSQVSSARPAESGIRPRSTNPPGGGRHTWKTARSAVSPTCCAWSTTRRGRNFSSPRSWSKNESWKADAALDARVRGTAPRTRRPWLHDYGIDRGTLIEGQRGKLLSIVYADYRKRRL